MMSKRTRHPKEWNVEAEAAEAEAEAAEVEIPDCEPIATADVKPRADCEVTLQLPLSAELPQGTVVPRHLETRLDARQGAALRRVFEGLQKHGVRLANGRHVESYAQVIRYLLEEVAGEMRG